MADAYLFAEGAVDENNKRPPFPTALVLFEDIKRYGVEAVTGRPVLRAGEILSINLSLEIISAYQSRKAAQNWHEWTESNPGGASLLANVEKIINAD